MCLTRRLLLLYCKSITSVATAKQMVLAWCFRNKRTWKLDGEEIRHDRRQPRIAPVELTSHKKNPKRLRLYPMSIQKEKLKSVARMIYKGLKSGKSFQPIQENLKKNLRNARFSRGFVLRSLKAIKDMSKARWRRRVPSVKYIYGRLNRLHQHKSPRSRRSTSSRGRSSGPIRTSHLRDAIEDREPNQAFPNSVSPIGSKFIQLRHSTSSRSKRRIGWENILDSFYVLNRVH